MRYNYTQWYVYFPIPCGTDLECETLNPWLSDEIWFFELLDVISQLV